MQRDDKIAVDEFSRVKTREVNGNAGTTGGCHEHPPTGSPFVEGNLEDLQSDTWFKIARSILDHPIWLDCPTSWLRVWLVLLASANWAPRQRRFGADEITVQPGQVIASVEWIALKSKVSTMQVRNALKYLSAPQSSQSPAGLLSPTNSSQEGQKTTSAVTLKTTSHGTLVTIRNWDRYQGRDYYGQQAKGQGSEQADNKPTTNGQQTSNNASRSIEPSTPVSSGKPPEETPTFLDGMEPSDNGPKPKPIRKAKPPANLSWPDWKRAAWATLLREDPKRGHCMGAKDEYQSRVDSETKAIWLIEAHRKQIAAGPVQFWMGFGNWLKGALTLLEAGLTPEETAADVKGEEEDMRPCQPPRRFAKSS